MEVANDYVRIFAGGTPLNDFLKKIGVQFGIIDVTAEASRQAKQAHFDTRQFAEARAGTSSNRKKVRRLEERRTIERHRKKLLLTLAI